jgi:predicted nuclease of predicted toxin-antitoxin system
MKATLDENLGHRGARILRDGGWDVATVFEDDLCASTDPTLLEVSRVDGRVLITLDKEFANPVRFRPSRFAGIVVLRLAKPLRRKGIDDGLRRVLALTRTRSPVGRLWIVDDHRIREFDEGGD